MARIFLLLPLWLLCVSVHADPSPMLPDVLARYRAAVGPQTPHGTQRTSGTDETGGLKGTYVTLEQGDKEWTESKIGIYDETEGTDGKVFWQRDSNGSVRLLSAAELQEARTDQAIDHDEFARADGFKGKVSLRPQMEKRTGCHILDVAPDGGNPVTLFIDPQTFLLTRQERDDDGTRYVTTFSNYRKLGGQMQPCLIRTHADKTKDKYDDVTTIDALDDVPDPDPSLFVVPVSPKNYTWSTPNATSAVIPFDDADNGIALYVVIDGHPTYLKLDSGAGGLALVKIASDRLGLPHQGVFQGGGYGGTVEESPVLLNTLEVVGGVIFKNVTASSLSVESGYANYQAVDTIGLMGYSLLSHFVVKVDYAAGQVTLTDPDAFTPSPADGVALPMELDDNLPSVLASFDGLPPARFLVDTGDALSAVHLYSPYVRDNKLANKYPKGMEIFGQGVGGESKARRVRAGSFSIAGVTVSGVPTDLSLDTKGMGASHATAGALGHDFLSRFTVTFDYPHQRLFFAPSLDTKKPFDTRTFGVYVMEFPDEDHPRSTQKVIVRVEDNSPAARAGVTEGQVLEKIDGKDASSLSMATVRRMLSNKGIGTRKLTVTSRGVGVINSQLTSTSDVTISLYDPVPLSGNTQ